MSYHMDVLAEENRSLRARVAELEAERDNRYQVGYVNGYRKGIADYGTRVAKLEAALRPFSDAGESRSAKCNDLHGASSRITLHDLRQASAVLANTPACPAGGYTGQPSTEPATVENCLAAGVCGCDANPEYARGHRDAIAECMARPMQWAGDER